MAKHGGIIYTVKFRGPFALATGSANGGLSLTVDEGNPLPATSLKGLMRAQARHVLGVSEIWVERVFGAAQTPCPWAWTDADFETTPTPGRSVRVAVTDTGAARGDMLRFGQQLWADEATFQVDQIGDLCGDLETHERILRASARSVSSLGGERRRGSGWVSITDNCAWTEDDTAAIVALRVPMGELEGSAL